MEYRYLGRSGLQVSALSFGSWVTFGDQIGDHSAYGMMEAAYEAGVNFFDTAEVYAGEPVGNDLILLFQLKFSGVGMALMIAVFRANILWKA